MDFGNVDEFIEKKEFLIVYVLNRWFQNYLQDDDFFQIGRIALWKAVLTYDENKGAKFDSYAITLIKRAMIAEIKRQTTQSRDIKKELYCFDETNFKNDKSEDVSGLKETLADETMSIEDMIVYRDAFDKLNDMERKVVYSKLNKIGEGKIEKMFNIRKHNSRKAWLSAKHKLENIYKE